MIVVSFGAARADAEESCIRPVERALAAAFPDREIRRGWTSRIIARRLAARGEALYLWDPTIQPWMNLSPP